MPPSCNPISGLFDQVGCLDLFPHYHVILFQAYFTKLFVLVVLVVVDIHYLLLYFPYLFPIQLTFLL
jgi:hypothetical protein